MAIAHLEDIILKVRRMTGSGSAASLTDNQIKDYINSYYLYDLPAQMRLLKLKDILTFNTARNVAVYSFENVQGTSLTQFYTSVQAPAFVAKRMVPIFFEPWPFYAVYNGWQNKEVLDYGDGTNGPYGGTTQNSPIIRSSNNNPANTTIDPAYPAARVQNLLISANTGLINNPTVHVSDDGAGNLVGDCAAGGTVDYETGVIAGLSFESGGAPINIPAQAEITIQYGLSSLARPQAILYFQDQFTLSPIPDQGYQVEVTVYRQPTQAMELVAADQGTPEQREWWELIAAGASKKVFEDRGDMAGIQLMDKMIFENLSISEARTYADLGSRQINTLFSQQLANPYYGNINFFPDG